MTHVALPLSDSAADQRRRWLTSAAVFVFAALTLVVPSGYSLGPAILLLAGCSLAVRRPRLALDTADWRLMLALVTYTAVVVAGALWHGQGMSTLDRPLRLWLALPALLWVMAYPPRLGGVWAGLALGAMGAGGFALWQRGQGVARADGYMHAIQFGNISLLLGVFCLAGAGWGVAAAPPPRLAVAARAGRRWRSAGLVALRQPRRLGWVASGAMGAVSRLWQGLFAKSQAAGADDGSGAGAGGL